MKLKLALPKGRLLKGTRTLMQRAGIELADYEEEARSYRPRCDYLPDLLVKVFQEKDIPIQVAVGNYDLGICGLDWIEELLVKYPSSALAKVHNLDYGEHNLCVAASPTQISSIEELLVKSETVQIASEYPNLAESFALDLRLKKFKVFPLWGAAEAYPPESADLVLISQPSPYKLAAQGLIPLTTVLESKAFLIANRYSWESKNLSSLLDPLCAVGRIDVEEARSERLEEGLLSGFKPPASDLRLALPDGHQQQPMTEFLDKAGIKIWGYSQGSRRPIIDLDGVSVKVIRPQDMPLQVANNNFDLAITGEDWLYDHLHGFPSSPVRELLDLEFGRVKVVAVVSQELPVKDVYELRKLLAKGNIPSLRIASEYVNIADRYAQANHLSPYRIIPTWGASEAFLPEDADLLIENTQTGQTLAQHQLKIIDTLFESSACLIGSSDFTSPARQERIASIVQIFQHAIATHN